jgi:predicted  nucleic acid-binding Zn-ribbon protein
MQAINNAETVKWFRGELTQLSQRLDDTLRQTEQAVEQLTQTWRDMEFQHFSTKFETDKQMIRPLNDKIIEFESVVLKRKEDKIRTYLGN